MEIQYSREIILTTEAENLKDAAENLKMELLKAKYFAHIYGFVLDVKHGKENIPGDAYAGGPLGYYLFAFKFRVILSRRCEFWQALGLSNAINFFAQLHSFALGEEVCDAVVESVESE